MITYILLIVLVLCIFNFFPNVKKIDHKEIFKNIDPHCDNYAKKGCSMPGKISNTCYKSNLFKNKCNKSKTTDECEGPKNFGTKCYDEHYELCIS